MALVLADRVRETTVSNGTSAVTLGGAYTGFQTFLDAIGNSNTTYYTISNVVTGEWEVGIGTYTSSGNTLSRDTVLSSSNAGSLVSFTTGTKDVFVTQPAERAVYLDSATNTTVPGLTATGQITSTLAGNATTGAGQVFLNGTTSNRLDFNTNGVAAPTTTTRSAGTKVTLYPALSGSAVDYAVGVEAGALWASIPGNDGGQFFKWYGAATQVASLSGTGVFIATGGMNGTLGAATPNTVAATSITASLDSSFDSVGALKIPAGTTGDRPTGAVGKIRWNSTLTQYEGYDGTNWTLLGGAVISNDTSTASSLYPTFAGVTTGNASTLYTSNAKLLYKPSTGEFQMSAPVASNGIVVNSLTVTASYTIASGFSGASAGPITLASGVVVTVAGGSRWVIS